MRELPLNIKTEERLKSMTGLSFEKYELLHQEFNQIFYDEYRVKKKRRRKAGGGRKNTLPDNDTRLLFTLYYFKTYPTFEILGDRFGMAKSTANILLHHLKDFVAQALSNLNVMPKRSFDTVQEFRDYLAELGGINEVLIDATEREHFRYQDTEKREHLFSGKNFTVKNTIITTVKKLVLFIGLTTQGSFHDYALLKEEFPPELDWFECLKVAVDLGYLGMQKDYVGQVDIPHKKPRKSKRNLKPELTEIQKAENTAKSKVRIYVENAITGIKRYNILVHKYRNKRKNFEDNFIAISTALWNLRIS